MTTNGEIRESHQAHNCTLLQSCGIGIGLLLRSSRWFPHQESHRLHIHCDLVQSFGHLGGDEIFLSYFEKPGKISAVNFQFEAPPSRMMESG